MLLLHDFDASEVELTVEVECGEVQGGQNGSGLTCSMVFCLKGSGRTQE